jgi:hypothetical protein
MKKTQYNMYIFILLGIYLTSFETAEPTLVSWSKELTDLDGMEEKHSYFDNHKNFIEPYFSVEYKADTIYATTLHHEQCVDKTIGLIEVSHDTIYLQKRVSMTKEPYCPEFYKYNYTIYNPGQKEYEIVSVK